MYGIYMYMYMYIDCYSTCTYMYEHGTCSSMQLCKYNNKTPYLADIPGWALVRVTSAGGSAGCIRTAVTSWRSEQQSRRDCEHGTAATAIRDS